MTKLTEIVIRVVGSWNTKIFTPIWISETLLNFNIKDSLEIVFNKELQPAFIFKGIRIIPNENYVDVLIFKAGQELTTETKEIAAKVVLNLMTTYNDDLKKINIEKENIIKLMDEKMPI